VSRLLGLAAVCVVMLAGMAVPARAQETSDEAPAGVRFLPRYVFHMTGEHLSGDDPRLVWEANYGGELDLVDFGSGRVTFTANYQVLLGEEIRIFDPNQGNYLLEASVSRRVRGIEFAGVFHHVSRHLSDRDKQNPLDWNMVGVRAHALTERNSLALEARADLLTVIQHSFVDYQWEARLGGGLRAQVAPRLVMLSRVEVDVLGVDGTADRGTQAGFRLEGGVSLEGDAGSIELFVAVERRVDPIPFERSAVTWTALGFRLVGR
jgi:hypothetical protein